METNEVLDNETVKLTKSPVTLQSLLGLIAVIVAALMLCAPYAKNPGEAPAKAPAAVEAVVETNANPTL